MQRLDPGASPDHGDVPGCFYKASLLWYAGQPVSLPDLLFEIKLRRNSPPLGESVTYLLAEDFPQRVLPCLGLSLGRRVLVHTAGRLCPPGTTALMH